MSILKIPIILKLRRAEIVKVFSLNALSTLVRMLTGMISVKIVAAIIGPSGIALLGQLNNMVSILLGMANGGIQSGVTKYVSEYKEEKDTIRRLLSNALRITLFFTLLVALGLILLHDWLSERILLSHEYGYVFLIFGFTIVLYTLNMLFISILNGYKQFRKYVVVNISGTVIGLLFSVVLVLSLGLSGALINAVTFQSVVFLVTLWQCRKCEWFLWENFNGKTDRTTIRKYLKYSLMTITSLAVVPVSQMVLRGYVISEVSMTEAGWWEAMNRISSMYLSVITTSFSIYYLPRLSEIKDNGELRREIFRCYKFIIPLLLGATMMIFLLRRVVIWLLFSPDFYPMENLFIWQLLGDLFKISSWLLAYLMVAKALTKKYIFTEILFSASFVGLGFLFMKMNGTVGLTQAYMVNYILYLLCMVILFRKILFIHK